MVDFIEAVMKAKEEAYKEHIRANMMVINEGFAKVPISVFGEAVWPAMICGLESYITRELPDDVAFAIFEGGSREKERETVNDFKSTVDLMLSEDYKERFKAEYYQTKIRYDKLHKMCVKYEAGTLDFDPDCSLELLKEQKAHMGRYLNILEIRAEIEGVTLEDKR